MMLVPAELIVKRTARTVPKLTDVASASSLPLIFTFVPPVGGAETKLNLHAVCSTADDS
jgi:hypothetical protein